MKKIIKDIKEICLDENEKISMKTAISEYAKQKTILSPYAGKSVISVFWSTSRFAGKHLVLAVILIMLTLGAGTSAMAQNALPGSLLYPVKIHINENLESFTARTPKAVAKIGIKQAARRLAEAEALSEKGELTASSTDQIKDSFVYEVSLVGEKVSELESKGATSSVEEIKDEFEKKINSREDIYFQISGSKNKKLDDVLETIKIKKEKREKTETENHRQENGDNKKDEIKNNEEDD